LFYWDKLVPSPTDFVSTQQPRPRTSYKLDMVFLIHTTQGWCGSFMSAMGPISV
jgi:hypothetical protein